MDERTRTFFTAHGCVDEFQWNLKLDSIMHQSIKSDGFTQVDVLAGNNPQQVSNSSKALNATQQTCHVLWYSVKSYCLYLNEELNEKLFLFLPQLFFAPHLISPDVYKFSSTGFTVQVFTKTPVSRAEPVCSRFHMLISFLLGSACFSACPWPDGAAWTRQQKLAFFHQSMRNPIVCPAISLLLISF